MTVEQFENDILTLAMRYVRTPEGAEKYDLPIGAPITPDAVAAAKAAGKNFDVPEDKPGTPSGKGKFMQGTISGKAQAAKTAPKPQAAKPLNLKVKTKPTLTGNQHFTVGSGKFSAPNGSKLIRPAGNPSLAYVVTPDGKVYAFIEAGEIEIPKVLEAVYKSKFTTDFEGDENYAVEEFEKSSASFAMDQLKVGTILSDAEGNPQFKKLAEDSWEHVDLGVKLKDEDLQDLYDEGDLIPDAEDEDAAVAEETFSEVDAVNFSEMSSDEAWSALGKMPQGQKLTVGDVVWTKDEKGMFVNQEGKVANPKSLSYVKNQIKIGADPEPEYNPLDAETKNPLDSDAKPLIGDTPNSEWFNAALPGAAFDYTNDAGTTTTWTKGEDGKWANQKGGTASPEALLYAMENTQFKGTSIKKEGKPPKDSAAKPASEPAAAPERPAAFPQVSDLGKESSPEDTLDILTAAGPGEQIHTFDGAATLTKVNDDASELEDYDDPEGVGGYWQSDITGKLLSSAELSEVWAGDLEPGPSKGDMGDSAKKAEAPAAPTAPAKPAFNSLSTPPLSPGVMYSDSMTALEISGENGFHPGDYDFTTEATKEDIQNAQPGDKFLQGNSPMEAEGDDDYNVWDAVDVVEKQEDGSWKSLGYPDGADPDQDDLEQMAEMQSYEEQPDQIWAFKGNTLNAVAPREPEAPATLQDAIDSDEDGLLDPIDAIPDEPEFDNTPEPGNPDEEEYDPAIPNDAVKITSLSEVPAGTVLYEDDPEHGIYLHTKDENGMFTTTLPSGMKVPGNTTQDVQEIFDNGDSTFYATPSATPAAEPIVLPDGARETGFDGASMAEGDVVYGVLTGSSPQEVFKFTKIKNGAFTSEGPGEEPGAVAQYEDLMAQADSGALKFYTAVGSEEDSAAPQVEKTWAVGDSITSIEDFDSVTPGTKLAYLKNNGEYSYYSTLGNGYLLTPGGNQMATSKLSWALGQGKVTVHELLGTPSAPEAPADPEDAVDAPEAPTPSVDSKEPNTQLWANAPAMSQEQLQAALTGLEEHSSFHVKYGLKNLPEGHPLKQESNQEALKAAALEKYPELKVKPAVMQALKDALGLNEPEGNWEDALIEPLPKISIGSKTPKKIGVQGMDGGEYTSYEIQDAINILEAYPGKLFKNELAKKGNPLGELDPTQIVGFDKDKLVTKQKYIDLLKTKLIVQEEQVKHPVISSWGEFENLPVGATVINKEASGKEFHWTKISESQWSWDDPDFVAEKPGDTIIGQEAFKLDVGKGLVSLDKLPDVVPDYAKTPPAVQSKEKTQYDVNDPNFSEQTLKDAPQGTQLEWTWADGTKGNTMVKDGEDTWTIYDVDGNETSAWSTSKLFKGLEMQKQGSKDEEGVGWQFKDVEPDQPKFNANQDFAIIPGKYKSGTGGAAYMTVNADGSGTYVTGTGTVSALTAEQVKKNYDAGMKSYQGLVSDGDTPKAPPKKSPAKNKPKTIADLPDGAYFGGDPADPKTSYYEVVGNDVKVFKPLTGISTDTGAKVGGNPNSLWLEAAGMGASFDVSGYWESGEFIPGRSWTKGSDGLWHGQNIGKTAVDVIAADIEPVVVPEFNYWAAKVTSHGVGDPVSMDKKKLNTLFAQGKLQDQYGMAVVPEGHTGTTAFFGVPTTVPALVMAQTWLNGPEGSVIENSGEFENKLKQLGVGWKVKNWVKWRKANGLMDPGSAGTKTAMKKALDDILTNVDTDIPESSTTDLFEWDPMGNPVMPVELAALQTSPYLMPEKKAWVKEASKHIGDGKVIGLHLSKASGYELSNWITAFQEGSFDKMYALEVSWAAKEGKAHSAGYLHPGFPDNETTKKVKWGAAVLGEVSALDTVPGNWTSAGIEPSMDEVNNYLISAQMQNPTYLSPGEKYSWYTAHRNKNKAYVDQLSATAAVRKKNGEAQLSDPLVWTDDVKPAKSYDKLFEANALPVEGWGLAAAKEYVQDHKDNDALQAIVAENLGDGFTDSAAALVSVKEYFKAENEKHAQALAEVFYKKSPVQKVEKGTHPIFEYDDFNGLGPVGNHYFFKPSPQGDQYRSQAEHLGHEFGWAFGFNTAQSELITLDGKYGQLQKDLGGTSDLAKFDLSTLNASQIADIGREHILDWFLDNDDTHSANMKVLSDGSIVGIDKGRAFKHFGKWQGLNPDAMNSNTQTVYSKLFTAIQSGKLSKEDVDKAYLAIQKRAVQMSKVSDEKISEMLAEGMKNRTVWDVSYKINGKAVPNSLAGLTAAVLDRKSKLPEQIEGMWAKVYADAGFGALPEPPAAKLGTEHYSGIGEAHFHEAAFAVNGGGVSSLVGGNFSTTGSALAWGTTNSDGTKNMYTQVELNHIADEKVYSKLQSMAPGAIAGPANPGKFSEEEYGGFFTRDYYRAMATIVKHNDDKEYNADRISDYNAAKIKLQKDLDHWKPVLPETSDGLIKFPSGAEVPTTQLIQYKMMLDFYKAKEPAMDASITTKAEFPVNQKTKFEAYELTPKPKVWNHFEGEMSMVEVSGGGTLWASQNGTKFMGSAERENLLASGEWKEMAPPAEGPKNYGGASIKLSSETFERKGEWDNDTGVIKATTQNVGSWAKGQEYHIELPTGEKIYFRNRAKTDTFKSQYGRLTIEVPKSTDAASYAAGLERAQSWISSYLSLEINDVEEEDAELIYWKQMLPSLTRRKLAGQTKYQAAFKDIEKKAQEIGSSTDDFGIRFGGNATAAEQNAFYREVWGKHFGKAKVDKLIADRAYLPEYEATDMHASSEYVQGRPAWMRFDISLSDLLASDSKAFVASRNTGGSDSAKLVAVSGVHLSTEERIRFFGGKSGGSSSSDQDMGTGGQDQFTRIWNDPNGEYDYVYHPKTALRTTSRFFNADAFGSENHEKSDGIPDPLTFWTKHQSNSGSLGGGNQFSVRWASSLMGSLEMVLFDNAADRDYAIQKLKLAGLDTIRGLPVEDRLVMRVNRAAAIAKLRAQWQKEAGL